MSFQKTYNIHFYHLWRSVYFYHLSFLLTFLKQTNLKSLHFPNFSHCFFGETFIPLPFMSFNVRERLVTSSKTCQMFREGTWVLVLELICISREGIACTHLLLAMTVLEGMRSWLKVFKQHQSIASNKEHLISLER